VTIENIRKAHDSAAPPIQRRRGRPPGARNKPRPPETPPLPAAMRIPDAARYTGLSASMVKKLLAQGRIRSVSVGRTRLVLVASLNDLLGV
jgi:excisionase family DNA binding protein